MNYWLMKSEPTTYSIDHLAAEPKKTDYWDGIRNYQARNMLRDDFKKGDLAFFYHSNCNPPGIVGVVEIVKEAYPDFTAFDPASDYYDPKSCEDNPRWFMVDVKLKKKFKQIISLDELRQHPPLAEMNVLQKGYRLSITPITPKEWTYIMDLA